MESKFENSANKGRLDQMSEKNMSSNLVDENREKFIKFNFLLLKYFSSEIIILILDLEKQN